MRNINIFCFGFGQVAENFINKIKSENYKISLSTTSSSKTCQKSFNGFNYENYFFKDESYDNKIIEKLKKADHILISIPPTKKFDPVIKNFSKIIENCKPKWITYLSATSVYGDHKGEWVNEESLTKPTSSNGLARLETEKSWLSLKINKNLPIQIFRLSGIYSNQNNILVRLKSGKAKIINKQNNFFSRIHVEDIANILFKSLSNFKSGEIYNISDDKPSTSEDVTLFGAKILDIKNIEKIEVDQIKSEMLKNFYNESKKVSNKKMKSYFNYNLKFPSYIEGLTHIRSNFI